MPNIARDYTGLLLARWPNISWMLLMSRELRFVPPGMMALLLDVNERIYKKDFIGMLLPATLITLAGLDQAQFLECIEEAEAEYCATQHAAIINHASDRSQVRHNLAAANACVDKVNAAIVKCAAKLTTPEPRWAPTKAPWAPRNTRSRRQVAPPPPPPPPRELPIPIDLSNYYKLTCRTA